MNVITQERHTRRTISIWAMLVAIAFALGCPTRGIAQMNTGTILGTVTDSSGAVIVGATVAVKNVGTGIVNQLVTDTHGEYSYPYLNPGSYSVTAQKADFTTQVREGITIQINTDVRVNFTLTVGSQAEVVVVQGVVQQLQSDTSEVSQMINANTIVSMPLNIRDFAQLVNLTTGAVPNWNSLGGSRDNPDNPQGIAASNVNGVQVDANNWQLDGITDTEVFFRVLGVNPSIDSIQEFQVNTSNYAAEFGAAGGANVLVSIKSGTNQVHGEAFEFIRNSALDANDYFANLAKQPNLPFKQNQFGANIGGPIRKNSAFFFGDYEGYRSRQTTNELEVLPTALERQGIFTENGASPIYNPYNLNANGNPTPFPGNIIPPQYINQTSTNVLKLLPLPNISNVPLGNPNFYGTSDVLHDTDNFDVRTDLHFSDRNQFFGRYSILNSNLDVPPYLGVVAGGDPYLAARAHTKNQNVALGDTYMISPKIINEARFGVNRVLSNWFAYDAGTNISTQVGIPGINGTCSYCGGLARVSIAGLNPFGHTPWSPTLRHETVWQWVDNVTFELGRHTVKTGVDIRRVEGNVFQTANPLGEFDFDQRITGNLGAPGTGMGIASFLLGRPVFAGRAAITDTPSNRGSQYFGFAQDDVRITKTLTLNLGLRYDYYTTITDAHGKLSNFQPSTGDILLACVATSCSGGINGDKNDWGPRIGFAYTPNHGSTVIRSAFGISYFYPQAGFLVDNFPFVQGQGYTPANFFTVSPSDPLLSDGMPPLLPVENRPGAPAGHLIPTGGASGAGFTSVDYLPSKTQMSRVYQWQLGVETQLQRNLIANLAYVGNSVKHITQDVTGNYPEPGQDLVSPTGQPLSLQQRRPYYSVDPDLATIDEKLWAASSNYNSLQARLEKRFSNNLSFLASYTWSKVLTSGENYQNPSNYMATVGPANFDTPQRFVLSTVYELPYGNGLRYGGNSNRWLNGLLGGWELSGIYSIQSGQPFMPSFTSTLDNGNSNFPNQICNGRISHWTINKYYNTTCFVAPPLNQFGDTEYNPLYGPAFRDLDMALTKKFKWTEKRYVEFHAEAFNLPNNENFGEPNNFQCDGSCGEGAITSSAAGSNPRQLQFAVKLYF